MLNFVIHCLAS